MSIATQPPGSRPATPSSSQPAGGALIQRIWQTPRYITERVSQLSTPALLRLLLGFTWGCALLLWLTAYLGTGVYRNGLQRIGRDASTSIIQGQRIKSALTAMDASVVQLLLIPSGSRDASVVGAQAQARAIYEARRQDFGTALVDAAANMKDDYRERDLIIRLQNEASLYDGMVAQAFLRNKENAEATSAAQANSPARTDSAIKETTPPPSPTPAGSSVPTASSTSTVTTIVDSTDTPPVDTPQVRALKAQHSAEDIANYRAARYRLQKSLLRATEDLYTLKSSALQETYAAQANVQNVVLCLLVFFGMVLIAALVAAQWALFMRTRRLINPGLSVATLLAVGMFFWLSASFYLAAQNLQTTKEEGFSAITSLERAQSLAYEARSLEGFYLLLSGDKSQKAANVQFEAKFEDAKTHLTESTYDSPRSYEDDREEDITVPPTDTESDVVTQQSSSAGSDQLATLFGDYHEAHKKLVDQETIGQDHEAALESGAISLSSSSTATPKSAVWKFAAFDGALKRDLAAYQKDFDTTLNSGFHRLENREFFVTLLVLVIAAAAFCGISSRLKEYAV